MTRNSMMPLMKQNCMVALSAVALTVCVATSARSIEAQQMQQVREPIPLEVAASVHLPHYRSPIEFSADGEWLAHTIWTDEMMPRDTFSLWYTPTGVMFEGSSKSVAMLTNTKTAEVVRLGAEGSISWSPAWSPDGQRVAYYSDEGGEAGLWIRDRATRRAARFPGVIVRTFYGFEKPVWSANGEQLLVKLLGEGRTIAQANAAGPTWKTALHKFPEGGPDVARVSVRRAGPAYAPEAKPDADTTAVQPQDVSGVIADLALLDLKTQRVVRLASDLSINAYAFSPDDKRVAYAVVKGMNPAGSQFYYDLMVADIASGQSKRVAENVRMTYGQEWSWSPDGSMLAYIDCGILGTGELVIVSAASGERRVLKSAGLPRFSTGHDILVVHWDRSSRFVHAIGADELWRVDVATGQGTAIGGIPGWRVTAVVSTFGQPSIWSNDGGRTVWVAAREREGGQAGLFAIDTRSGKARPALREAASYMSFYNIAANEATGLIAFGSSDQTRLEDLSIFNTRTQRTWRLTHLNSELARYELGTTRVVEWQGVDGKPLRGALLLPPGYKPGTRLPLVTYVYGGELGSRSVNNFGLVAPLPVFNMQILATRGYAVFHPDVPVRTGQTMRDIYDAVMSGVDAVIEQGFADPERLAIMGHSYGSFSTLAVITQTTRFKAAIISAAVSHPNLAADYLRDRGYYEGGQGNMGGTLWEYPDRYRENSPIHRFDRIATPLLIGQGEKDGLDLVPSEAIFNALERLGKPVEYRVYEGEGHVIAEKANVIDFWKRRLEFLEKLLRT